MTSRASPIPRRWPNPYLALTRVRRDTGDTPEYDIDDYIGWPRAHPQEAQTVAP